MQLMTNKKLLNIMPLRLNGLKDVEGTTNVKKKPRTGIQNMTIQVRMDQTLRIAVTKMTPL